MKIDEKIKVIYLEVGGVQFPIDKLIRILPPTNDENYWFIEYGGGQIIWTTKEVLLDFREVIGKPKNEYRTNKK